MSATCDGILVASTKTETMNKSSRLTWLKLVTQDKYDEVRQKGSLLFVGEGLFEGEWSEFKAKRDQFFQLETFNLDVDEMYQVATSSVTEDKVIAWSNCEAAIAGAPKLQLLYGPSNKDTATYYVSWYTGEGGYALKTLEIEERTSGNPTTHKIGTFKGVRAFSRDRKADETITVTANGVMKDGTNKAAIFEIKRFVPPSLIERIPSEAKKCTVQLPTLDRGALVKAIFEFSAAAPGSGPSSVNCYASAFGTQTEDLSVVLPGGTGGGAIVRRKIVRQAVWPPNTPMNLEGQMTSDLNFKAVEVAISYYIDYT